MGGQSSKGIDHRESFDRTYPRAESWSQSLSQANPPPPLPPSSQGYDSYDAGTYQSTNPAHSPPRAFPPPGYPAQQQPSHQPPADHMGGQSSKGIDLCESFDRTYPQAESWSQSLSQANPPPPPPPSSQGYDSYDAGTYQSPYPAHSPPRAFPPPGYPAQQQPSHQLPADYPVQQQPSYQPPPKNAARPHRRLDRRLTQIADNYSSLEQVTEALARAGLESSNLIVGIDFTKSNEWTGKHSFNGRSLHHIGDIQNPYEQAISVIGRTLSAFDEDNLIPSFGFGDASTHDQDVFSFYQDGRPCRGFPEALSRYREIVPYLRLAGPTSFAPIIEMAMTIVAQSGGQYHVLVIIADGQVTRSVDIEFGQLSTQEQKTVDAIVRASEFPLSIVLVGVGDGPWDTMKQFDDNIPVRSFDNFQFVNFTEIMSKNIPHNRKETEFALAALMEIPPQYKATIELGILGRPVGKSPERVPLPPPIESYGAPSMDSKSFGSSSYQQSTPLYPTYGAPSMDSKSFGSSSYQQSTPLYPTYGAPSMDSKSFGSSSYQQSTPLYPTYVPPASSAASAPPASGDSWNDQQVCPICLSNPKNLAFGCGHQTCTECGPSLQLCPICKSKIATRIKLY